MTLFTPFCSGWLGPADDPLGIVDRIDQRIEDVTDLTMSTAEQLQVVNYGIGGHYEPHYDFARVKPFLIIELKLKLYYFRLMKTPSVVWGPGTEYLLY